MNLDYTPLHKEATVEDIAIFKAANDHGTKVSTIIILVVTGILLLFIVPIATVAILSSESSAFYSLGTLALLVITVITIVVFGVQGRRARLRKLVKFNNFAKANNLAFLFDRKNTIYTGSIFQHGQNRSFTESFIFPDSTELGNYQYTTGSGRSRRTYNWGYVKLKLARKLPHMLLDNKKNNYVSIFSNLPISLRSDQTLKLEGDFNNYFTLYAPKEYKRDALYVFTPDVMSALIDHAQLFDIEVIDDNLFLYSSLPIAFDSEQSIRSLLDIIGKIGTELKDQSDYYADERVSHRSLNEVAAPGRRLRSGVGVSTIVVIVLVFAYIAYVSTR